MSKVVILWFNFSSSTSYPHGPVGSGMSIYKADLVNTENSESEGICNCGCLQKRNINVKNRRETYLRIKDIRTYDNMSIDNHLQIHIFYDLLKDTIKEMHPHTFSFDNGRNMAISIDEGERFNDVQVIERFKTKLLSHYQFDAPIDVREINRRPSDEVDTIPFMNIDSDDIAKFVNWVKTRPRSPSSLTSISLGTSKLLKDRLRKEDLPKTIYDRITEDD